MNLSTTQNRNFMTELEPKKPVIFMYLFITPIHSLCIPLPHSPVFSLSVLFLYVIWDPHVCFLFICIHILLI